MRELKFRVWDSKSHHFLSENEFYLSKNGCLFLKHKTITNPSKNSLDQYYFSENRFTIQQYTALKDKNGKEIYEGDILLDKLTEEAAAEGDGADIGRVFFAAGAFMIDGSGTLYDQTYSHSPDRLVDHEVIGNIFENPELLIK